jgi:D-beta-D-heptose 7-phosphate kinase / D-beta-D-heptose 1-phosphate adenosyltransferase
MMTDLLDALDRVGTPRLLVLGDLILDRYTWGGAGRVSPEAAVLVLHARRQRVQLGGAAAVARLLRGLGAWVSLAGARGDDADGRLLLRLLDRAGVDSTDVVCDPDRPTTRKERFLAGGSGRPAQPLLRVDRECRRPLGRELEARLAEHLLPRLGRYDAILVSDYAKGVCTTGLLARLLPAAAAAGVPVLVDPGRLCGYRRYRGAALLAPNRLEAELATGRTIRAPEDALDVARRLRDRWAAEAVLVKLDRDGLALVAAGGPGRLFPAAPRRVRDVTGAGDLVLAVMGLCRAAGLPWATAAGLANVAAGLEVERHGVAPVRRAEVRAALAGRGGTGKLVTRPQMAALAEAHRRAGRTLVLTNGCFDLLHAGHVAALQEAAALGDVLVVAVNSDAGVRRLKGPGRPVVAQADRVALLAALACVDHVLLFDDDTPHALLGELRPDVLVKGGTYRPEEVAGREVVEAYGGRVCVTGRRHGLSTTALLAALRRPAPDGAG